MPETIEAARFKIPVVADTSRLTQQMESDLRGDVAAARRRAVRPAALAMGEDLLKALRAPIHIDESERARVASVAAHWARLAFLDDELDDLARLVGTALDGSAFDRLFRRRRLGKLREGHRLLYLEVVAHRVALYRLAMVARGGRLPADAVPWLCQGIGAEQDEILLEALRRAGAELWIGNGWKSLFALIRRDMNAAPAELINQDLYQRPAWRHQLPEMPGTADDAEFLS